jgi:hypothetical protein
VGMFEGKYLNNITEIEIIDLSSSHLIFIVCFFYISFIFHYLVEKKYLLSE